MANAIDLLAELGFFVPSNQPQEVREFLIPTVDLTGLQPRPMNPPDFIIHHNVFEGGIDALSCAGIEAICQILRSIMI